jgi:hypothetical protein
MRQKAWQAHADIGLQTHRARLIGRTLTLAVAVAVTITLSHPLALPLRFALTLRHALGAQFPLALHLAVAFSLTVAVELLLLLAGAVDLALRLGQHAGIMLGMLGKILGTDAITRKLGIAVELGVFFDDLCGRAPYLAIRTRTVKDAIDDVSATRAKIAVLVAPRP